MTTPPGNNLPRPAAPQPQPGPMGKERPPQPPPPPPPPSPVDETPLTLMDSEHGPVTGRPSSSSGSTTTTLRDSGDSPLPGRRDPADPSAGSSSVGDLTTGGFETVFGKIVVERGLVTPEEVELCNAIARDSGAAGEPRTIPDLLVEKEFITQRQLSRLRTEFEANKSSQKIPGYKIVKRLGSGAMATVFLARQLSLDRPVAIKVLPQKFSANARFIERFYKEGRAAAQLNHPNIVQAYDVGQAGEHHYFVMEYVDGATVYDRIVKHKRFEEKEAIEIIIQVARALMHAHERGFVHRDIKPKNIMLTKGGVAKLADLGLARAVTDKEAAEAEAGRAYGTPYYISPEQIRGEVSIGPPADIYGLGATFYHMITGKVPFDGKNPSEVMHRHLKEELRPPDHVNPRISAGCAQIIEMCMAKHRRDRYQHVKDLIQDLELVRKGLAPHFAHTGIGMSGLTTALTSPAPPPASTQPILAAAPPRGASPASPAFFSTPLGVVTILILGLSLVLNLILLASWLMQR